MPPHFLVYFQSAFKNQEYTTGNQDQVLPAYSQSGTIFSFYKPNGKYGLGKADDPGNGQQQQNPENHGDNKAYGTGPGLLFGWQLVGDNGYKYDVINPQDYFQNRKGYQCG
jgi:hypothetical protein